MFQIANIFASHRCHFLSYSCSFIMHTFSFHLSYAYSYFSSSCIVIHCLVIVIYSLIFSLSNSGDVGTSLFLVTGLSGGIPEIIINTKFRTSAGFTTPQLLVAAKTSLWQDVTVHFWYFELDTHRNFSSEYQTSPTSPIPALLGSA